MFRFVSLLVFTAPIAAAQTAGASLQGAITDPSGAFIPRAQIEIHNVGTGAVSKTASDAAGRFHAPLLPPGEYEVRFEAPGFQQIVRKGIHLAVGQEAVLDIEMK